jgi:hypothetical protein
MSNTNILKNLDVNGVYAIGTIVNTSRQTGVLIGGLGQLVAKFINLGSTKLQVGTMYDIENAVYDGVSVFIDDETTIHHYISG